MSKKRYTMNVSIILGVSAILMLYIFVLVAHHHGDAERVRLDRSALLSSASSVAERIKPVGEVTFAAAETPREPVKIAVAAPTPGRDGKQVYEATCIACHGAGIAGAPKVEDKGDRKSTRLNSSHQIISYAVFCLKKKKYAQLCILR